LQPALGIAPIREAILRLDPSGSVFTQLHLLLVKLALESRAYNAVVPVLDKFILYFPGSISQTKPKFLCDLSLSPTAFITSTSGLASTKFIYQEVLEYFLCSGMVYIGLRNWESALECLENAVTYPAKDGAVSKIMVEAYKKWIIVGLLLEGKQLSLPRSISSGSAKLYHTLAKPYESVAQLFESATASRLKAEVDAGARIWREDFNTGLLLQVLAAYQKFQIRNLANIYSKISIPEVVNQTMSAETGNKLTSARAAETLIKSMIADGTLNATMSNSPNSPAVLTFKSDGPILSETQIQRELAASTERIQALTQEIKQTDRMLTHDKEYIKYAQKQKKNAKNSQADQGIAGAEMDWNSMEDEDIMGVY
jgi:COP9 signalosome complex subunit 3